MLPIRRATETRSVCGWFERFTPHLVSRTSDCKPLVSEAHSPIPAGTPRPRVTKVRSMSTQERQACPKSYAKAKRTTRHSGLVGFVHVYGVRVLAVAADVAREEQCRCDPSQPFSPSTTSPNLQRFSSSGTTSATHGRCRATELNLPTGVAATIGRSRRSREK